MSQGPGECLTGGLKPGTLLICINHKQDLIPPMMQCTCRNPRVLSTELPFPGHLELEMGSVLRQVNSLPMCPKGGCRRAF